MNREKAITLLYVIRNNYRRTFAELACARATDKTLTMLNLGAEYIQAIDMAIEALTPAVKTEVNE